MIMQPIVPTKRNIHRRTTREFSYLPTKLSDGSYSWLEHYYLDYHNEVPTNCEYKEGRLYKLFETKSRY